jgi:hypothetical protein
MMDHDDFGEINLLLEKCCDSCLLTRAHCASCRIEKLRDILGRLSKSSAYELISLEDLKILVENTATDQACASKLKVIEKWRNILRQALTVRP